VYRAGGWAPQILGGAQVAATATGQVEVLPILRAGSLALAAIDASYALSNSALGQAVHKADAAANDNGKKCPNPNGKKGGAEHQAEVDAVEQQIKERGNTPDREHQVDTPGGEKTKRFVDVAELDPTTQEPIDFHQVGKETQAGNPIAREQRAIDDILEASGLKPLFHPYN
jgi:hypothetical protein